MKFLPDNIYHVYNQGNNHQQIFNCDADYLIFLRKMRSCILPHADFIAYCLMPSYFDFLLYADDRCNNVRRQGGIFIDPITNGFRKLLSGYARIFNFRYRKTGSLFRQKTRAKCLLDHNTVFEKNLNTNRNYVSCFHYIHQDPYRAGLVSRLEDWKYSSFRDYAELRDGSLCNKKLAADYCGFDFDTFLKNSNSFIDEEWIKEICHYR